MVFVRLLSKKAPLIGVILWPKTQTKYKVSYKELLWSKWGVLMVSRPNGKAPMFMQEESEKQNNH